jgi:hypothetical protein
MEASMRKAFTHVITTASAGILLALASGPVDAKSARECDQEYVLRKDVVEAATERKADFMAECRTLATGEPTPITASERPGARGRASRN